MKKVLAGIILAPFVILIIPVLILLVLAGILSWAVDALVGDE